MKRILKSICCLLLLFAMSFSIVGCSNNDDTNKDSNNNTTTNESDEDNGLEGIDSRVKNKFSSDYKVNRDDVNEAVNYIRDNIDDAKVRFDQFKTDLDSGVDTAVDKFMDFFK